MCNEMLRHGMTDLADCHARVVDMLTMCEAMWTMAAADTAPATRVKALAALCADTCRDCERACKPQAVKHPECRRAWMTPLIVRKRATPTRWPEAVLQSVDYATFLIVHSLSLPPKRHSATFGADTLH